MLRDQSGLISQKTSSKILSIRFFYFYSKKNVNFCYKKKELKSAYDTTLFKCEEAKKHYDTYLEKPFLDETHEDVSHENGIVFQCIDSKYFGISVNRILFFPIDKYNLLNFE